MNLLFYVGPDSRYTEEAHCALKTKKRFFPEVDCFSFSQRPQLKGRLTAPSLNAERQVYALLSSKTVVLFVHAILDLAYIVCCELVVSCWIG